MGKSIIVKLFVLFDFSTDIRCLKNVEIVIQNIDKMIFLDYIVIYWKIKVIVYKTVEF